MVLSLTCFSQITRDFDKERGGTWGYGHITGHDKWIFLPSLQLLFFLKVFTHRIILRCSIIIVPKSQKKYNTFGICQCKL